MFYDNEIRTAKTPLELELWILREMEAFSLEGEPAIHHTGLSEAIGAAIGIRRKNEELDLPDIPADLVGLQNWCINAKKVFDAKATKKKKSIPIGPQAVTERPPEPEYAETTPQNMAEGFKNYANSITETANSFACRLDDPELARLYIDYRQSVENWAKLAKKHLDKDLSTIPKLPGNDYFAGMVNLADYCKKCDDVLMGRNTKGGKDTPEKEIKDDAMVRINGANRFIDVEGLTPFFVKGENQWDFLKYLVLRHKADEFLEHSTENKNSVDGLRNALKKEFGKNTGYKVFKRIIISDRRAGYRLGEVTLIHFGQMGIHRTIQTSAGTLPGDFQKHDFKSR